MKITLKITFGSDFQKQVWETGFLTAIKSLRDYFLSRHKDNKFEVEIDA